MKLVNVDIDFVVVEFKDDQVIFYDRFLEEEMRSRGIAIPLFLQKEYGDKPFVRLNDDEFKRAFKEVYVPHSMDNRVFKWVS